MANPNGGAIFAFNKTVSREASLLNETDFVRKYKKTKWGQFT